MALSGTEHFGSTSLGTYFQNNLGTAAVILSLATNIIATALIAYQAWWRATPTFHCDVLSNRPFRRRHWRVLRTHLVKGHGTQSALKMLALLVESGVVYSIFLVRYPRFQISFAAHLFKALIVAWEGVGISLASGSHPHGHSVLLAFDYLLTGCLVPLIVSTPFLLRPISALIHVLFAGDVPHLDHHPRLA